MSTEAVLSLIVLVASLIQAYLLLKLIRVADSIAKEFDDGYARQLEAQIDFLERRR